VGLIPPAFVRQLVDQYAGQTSVNMVCILQSFLAHMGQLAIHVSATILVIPPTINAIIILSTHPSLPCFIFKLLSTTIEFEKKTLFSSGSYASEWYVKPADGEAMHAGACQLLRPLPFPPSAPAFFSGSLPRRIGVIFSARFLSASAITS